MLLDQTAKTGSVIPLQELITIVVCTYNRASSLEGALHSLSDLRTDSTFTYEILVVDDGSTDDSTVVVQRFTREAGVRVRYVRQENQGVASARNTGVAQAQGSWIAFFDDDQLADQDWLVNLYDAAKLQGAGIVGGPTELLLPKECDGTLPLTIQRLLGHNPFMCSPIGSGGFRIDPRRGQNTMPGTGNALVKREVFERVGVFSESRGYGEDLDFFRRASQRGERIGIASGAIVHHVIPASRLTADYLLAVAAKGGASQGGIDSEVLGLRVALQNVTMRVLHLTIVTFPGLLKAFVVDGPMVLLGRRCSVVFGREYIREVASVAHWKLRRGSQ